MLISVVQLVQVLVTTPIVTGSVLEAYNER